MKRISPSVLTGLFSEGSKSLPVLPPSGKRQPPLNMAFLGPVFSKGHVFEHDALHHLKTEERIENVQGQNAFERFFEYLSKDILRFYKQSYWLLASNTTLFFENLMEFLRQKLLSEDDKSMAREQQSPYLLKEQAVATDMLKSLRQPLMELIQSSNAENPFNDRRKDWTLASYSEMRTKGPVVQQMLSVVEKIRGYKSAYTVEEIEYLLPRFTFNINDTSVVCIPDGKCNYNGVPTVVEIKCPVSSHYSLVRPKLWLKYFIQIAIELYVTGTEQAIFMCWYEGAAKYIVLSDFLLAPLRGAVFDFIGALGAGEKTTLEKAYARVSEEVVLCVLRELYTIFEILKITGGWLPQLHEPTSKDDITTHRGTVAPAVDAFLNQCAIKMIKPYGFQCRFEVPKAQVNAVHNELQRLIGETEIEAVQNLLNVAVGKLSKNFGPFPATESKLDSSKAMFRSFTLKK